jgi:hypothetical protein
MPLQEFLMNSDIPRSVKDFVRKQGFHTLDDVFLFLNENPSFMRRQLQLPGMTAPLNPDQLQVVPDRLPEILDTILKDASLSSEVREMICRTGERYASLPLGVPLHSSDPGPDEPGADDEDDIAARPVTARDFVKAVEDNARIQGEGVKRLLAPVPLIDLTPNNVAWSPGNQLNTPACIPYTLASCVELHRHQTSPRKDRAPESLSARFLYRQARLRHFNNTQLNNTQLSEAFLKGGLKLAETKDTLREDGICSEGWFPNHFEVRIDAAANFEEFQKVKQKIPDGAIKDAAIRRFLLDFEEFNEPASRPPGVAQKIRALLSDGHAVAVTIPAFCEPSDQQKNIWHGASLGATGILPLPSPDHIRGTMGHAVCVLGYFPHGPMGNPYEDQGYRSFPGYFLFRNSWGVDFPSEKARSSEKVKQILGRELPEGYGLIPATLMEYFVWEYGIVKPIP